MIRSVLAAALCLGVSGQRCKDRDFTGFDLNQEPATCEQLIGHCVDPGVGNEIKLLCPETCGTCVRSGKDVTADDVYVELTKLIVVNNQEMVEAGDSADYASYQTKVDDFYATMSSYSTWMQAASYTVAKAAAIQANWKKHRIYVDAALKAHKQAKEITYIQAGLPGPVTFPGWASDKTVQALAQAAGSMLFQDELATGQYVVKQRPANTVKSTDTGVSSGGYTTTAYQRELVAELPPPLPSVGVDWVPPTITSDELYENYFKLNRPVIIGAGVLDDWPAKERWTRQGLLQLYPGIMLNASSMPKPQYAQSQSEINPPSTTQQISITWNGEPFFFDHMADVSPAMPDKPYMNGTLQHVNFTLDFDGNPTFVEPLPEDWSKTLAVVFVTDSNFHREKMADALAEAGAQIMLQGDAMMQPPEHEPTEDWMSQIPILTLDRTFLKKLKKLMINEGVSSMPDVSLTVEAPRGSAGAVGAPGGGPDGGADGGPEGGVGMGSFPGETSRDGADGGADGGADWMPPGEPGQSKSKGERFDQPAEYIPMVQFVNEVMSGENGNLTHPEGRYIFNTFGKGVQPGSNPTEPHPMWKDVVWPKLIRDAMKPMYDEPPHGEDTSIEFFLGPALSGAYPHTHSAAWNACLYGRKRWIITTPEKWDIVKANNANMPIHLWLKTKYHQIQEKYPGLFWEFIQEPGEIVYIPSGWGHGIINIEPTIGLSMQLGTESNDFPDAVAEMMNAGVQ